MKISLGRLNDIVTLIESLLKHEGAEGFSFGLRDRAELELYELKSDIMSEESRLDDICQ